MTQINVRSNDFASDTVKEIEEIVMKNYLKQQKITYHKMSDLVGKVIKTVKEDQPSKVPSKEASTVAGGDSPSK